MIKPVRFVDPVCYKPYDLDTLVTEPLGGTEATVLRVLYSLYASDRSIDLFQMGRVEMYSVGSLNGDQFNILGMGRLSFVVQEKPGVTIVLRDIGFAIYLKQHAPKEEVWVWLHDTQTINVDAHEQYDQISALGIGLICVSEWHRATAVEVARSAGRRVNIKVIPNPVITYEVNATKPEDYFLFFSSPHKGLARTIEVFERIITFPEFKDFKLKVANPGYYKLPEGLNTNPRIEVLGALPHAKVLEEVAKSFCVLHLNGVFPETFGLVHAEAIKLGKAVLTGMSGANPEVITHPNMLLSNINDNKAVIERLLDWKKYGTPKAQLSDKYSIDMVRKQWDKLLYA